MSSLADGFADRVTESENTLLGCRKTNLKRDQNGSDTREKKHQNSTLILFKNDQYGIVNKYRYFAKNAFISCH